MRKTFAAFAVLSALLASDGAWAAVSADEANLTYEACALWIYGPESARAANPKGAGCFAHVLSAWRYAIREHIACPPSNIGSDEVMRAAVNRMADGYLEDAEAFDADSYVNRTTIGALKNKWPCTAAVNATGPVNPPLFDPPPEDKDFARTGAVVWYQGSNKCVLDEKNVAYCTNPVTTFTPPAPVKCNVLTGPTHSSQCYPETASSVPAPAASKPAVQPAPPAPTFATLQPYESDGPWALKSSWDEPQSGTNRRIFRKLYTGSAGYYKLTAETHDASTTYGTSTCYFWTSNRGSSYSTCITDQGERYELKPRSIAWLMKKVAGSGD